MVVELFHAERRTDGHDEANSRFSPKNYVRGTLPDRMVSCFNVAFKRGLHNTVVSLMPILPARGPQLVYIRDRYVRSESPYTQWLRVLPQFACRPCGSAASGWNCQSFNEAVSQKQSSQRGG